MIKRAHRTYREGLVELEREAGKFPFAQSNLTHNVRDGIVIALGGKQSSSVISSLEDSEIDKDHPYQIIPTKLVIEGSGAAFRSFKDLFGFEREYLGHLTLVEALTIAEATEMLSLGALKEVAQKFYR